MNIKQLNTFKRFYFLVKGVGDVFAGIVMVIASIGYIFNNEVIIEYLLSLGKIVGVSAAAARYTTVLAGILLLIIGILLIIMFVMQLKNIKNIGWFSDKSAILLSVISFFVYFIFSTSILLIIIEGILMLALVIMSVLSSKVFK